MNSRCEKRTLQKADAKRLRTKERDSWYSHTYSRRHARFCATVQRLRLGDLITIKTATLYETQP